VPLLIHREGDERLQGRVGEPVSHVDVLPTLRALLGDGDSAGELGVNLLALPREAAAERPLFAMRKGVLGRHEVELRSVVRGRYKLIVREPGAAVELYDWWADPGEQHDLSTLRPGIVSELRDLIAGQSGTRVVRSGAAESGGALDPALLEQLDELGYGTGGVNEGVPEAPSPPRPGGVEGPH
jgi:arylsulfatase A-like enzyme